MNISKARNSESAYGFDICSRESASCICKANMNIECGIIQTNTALIDTWWRHYRIKVIARNTNTQRNPTAFPPLSQHTPTAHTHTTQPNTQHTHTHFLRHTPKSPENSQHTQTPPRPCITTMFAPRAHLTTDLIHTCERQRHARLMVKSV